MKILRAAALVLWLGFFLLPLGGFAQTEDATKVFGQANNSVVTLVVYGEGKTEIAKGTGFALSEDIIATTYHLISQAVDVEGVNIKGKKVKIEGIVAVDKTLDIAFLKVKGKLPPLVSGNSDEIASGARVFAVGSNEAGQLGVSEGTVRGFLEVPQGQKLLEFSLSIADQFCGAPLLGLNGQVLGNVVCMGRGLKFGLPINLYKNVQRQGKAVDFKSWQREDYFSTLEGALMTGRVAALMDDQMTARVNLEKAVKLNPNLIDAHWLLATVYTKQRDYSSAITAYKRVIELDDKRADAHYNLASVYLRMQRAADAVPALEKAIALNYEKKEVYLDLGTAYEDLQNFAKAAEALERYLSLKPESTAPGYMRLGTCRMKLNQYEAAIAAFEEARKVQPNDVNTNVNLGQAYEKAGQLEKAEEIYKNLAQINPQDGTTYFGWIVRMYDATQKYDKAIEAAKKIIDLNPKSELAVYNLGIMYLKLQRYDEAVDAFKQALVIKPDYTTALYNVGYAYSLAKKWRESADGFKKYVELAPDDANGWLNIGIAFMMLKNFEGALEPMKKSLNLNPNNAAAQYNLAIVYINLKDYYSAREVHKVLQGLDPNLAGKLAKLLR